MSGRRMEAYYAEFQAQPQPSEPHQHKGAEIIYVVTGQLVVDVDSDETMLGEGDAMYFDSGFPHSYRRHGGRAGSAIVVVTP